MASVLPTVTPLRFDCRLPPLPVYDVTEFVKTHPGGAQQLMRGVGKDCTELFYFAHAWIPAGSGVRSWRLLGCVGHALSGSGPAPRRCRVVVPPPPLRVHPTQAALEGVTQGSDGASVKAFLWVSGPRATHPHHSDRCSPDDRVGRVAYNFVGCQVRGHV